MSVISYGSTQKEGKREREREKKRPDTFLAYSKPEGSHRKSTFSLSLCIAYMKKTIEKLFL